MLGMFYNTLAFPLDFSANDTKSNLARGFLIFKRLNMQVDFMELRMQRYPSLRRVIEEAVQKDWEVYKKTDFIELSMAHQHLLLLLKEKNVSPKKIQDEYVMLEDGIRKLLVVYKFYLQHCLLDKMDETRRKNGFTELANIEMQLYLYRFGRMVERVK